MGHELEQLGICSMELDRSIDVVRKMAFDARRTVEHQIHHGVTLALAADGKTIQQTTKILSRTQLDEYVIEEGEGDTWVRRFTGGPNTGAKLVGRFFALADGKGRVQLVAMVPRTGYLSGLGKLSTVGMSKMLERILVDWKNALDGFDPPTQRRTVDYVLASLREMPGRIAKLSADEKRAVFSSVLEAATLVAIADTEADLAERDALRQVVQGMCDVKLDDAALSAMIASAFQLVEQSGMEERCAVVGEAIAAARVADVALTAASLVALVSHGIGDAEWAALQRIASSAGIAEVALNGIIKRVDESRS